MPFSVFATGSVMLVWNPSTSTNVVGYKIYYGLASGIYSSTNYVAGSTNATVTGLIEGTTYYFAAKAVNTLGDQSPFSNETSNSVPRPSVPLAFPTLNPLPNLTINENAGLQTVNLSGITSGATNEVQTLKVTAVSSNPGLIQNPTVNYTSPNAVGTLSFTPASGNYGTATVTVTVNDNGASNNIVTRVFTVTVNAVNQPPTLNALPNLTMNENAGLQTVNLSGITSGATNEVQTLKVTAVSSNPGLIPNPTVNYTSPNAVGTLSFTPASGNYGTATVTVTVNDNGASNNIVTRVFTVTVNAVNQPPTQDPLIVGNVPTISTQPQTQTAEAGGAVNLTARVAGNPPPTCRWFFNGNAIGGQTNQLRLSGIQSSNVGAYTLVASNVWGAVTSAPAMLNVIAPVGRRSVPAVNVMANPGSSLGIDNNDVPGSTTGWKTVVTMTLSNASQFYFDISQPLSPQRLYRVWQSGTSGPAPSLSMNFVPAITLTGNAGGSVRVDYINAIGPTNAWVTLGTVTLTNTSQLYFDVSMLGQLGRLYRVVPVP